MLGTIRQLWDRYQTANLVFVARPIALRDLNGGLIGYVEAVEYAGGEVRVSGWCLHDHLQLLTPTARQGIRRRLHRGDVMQSLGEAVMRQTGNGHGRVAFDDQIAWRTGPLFLMLRRGGRALTWRLPLPSMAAARRARRRLALPFLLKAARAMPLGVRFVMRGQPKLLRAELARHFGLHRVSRTAGEIDDAVFAPDDLSPKARTPISIILPVYNAFDLLPEVLDRIESHTDLPWTLVLIEDCSTDSRVRPWLRDWAAARPGSVRLVENAQNLGFIGSVNRGFDLTRPAGHPVILFNSDAFVAKGWASRLIAPLVTDPTIASVTPMSNDATIFSVPAVAGTCQIPPGAVDRIDAVAATLDWEVNQADAPTGVGFCMALSPDALRRIPHFDTAFGRGYGEEVDWCQKVARTGLRNVGIGNLFVEHRGGQSFGQDHKLAAIAAAGQIVTKRHPLYNEQVQDFIRQDPLWRARAVLALALAASRATEPLHLYLGHSMGGGAQSWLRQRIADRAARGHETVTIAVGGSARFHVALHLADGPIEFSVMTPSVLCRVFRGLGPLHVVYSCGVGDPDPVSLPDLLIQLAQEPGSTVEMLFHDYLPISPSFNLLDSDATFRSIPDPDGHDPAHAATGPDGQTIPLRDWRAAWGRLVDRADRITVFSSSSREIVAQCWPDAAARIRVLPSSLPHAIPRLAEPGHRPPPGSALAVLGAIGEEKGARIVSALSRALAGRPDGPLLVIIGEFDRRFPLDPSTVVTGRYDLAQLPDLVRRHNVGVWLMPSVCPETFSFTTHEMLATGLPVLAFGIGAQGEAVAAAPNGCIVLPQVEAILDAYAKYVNV